MNKKVKDSTQESRHQNNNRRTQRLRLMIAFIVLYIFLALVLVIVFAPEGINYIQNTLRYIDSEIAMSIFLMAVIILIMMTMMLVVYVNKYKEVAEEEKKSDNTTTHFYGEYSEERSYLEKQIEALTLRLTNTENKWMEINHLLLAANDKNLSSNGRIYKNGFLSAFGIDPATIEIDKKMVFVLTPSSADFVGDYLTVRKVCQECNLRALRGDDTELHYGENNILTYILQHILKSQIIIANISNRNPNVFYELGIAHMAGKPTILICRDGSDIPFDLQQKFVLFYSSPEDLSIKLKDAIIKIYTENKL